MVTGRKLEQRNRDREAEDYADIQAPPTPSIDIVHSVPPIYLDSADDVWDGLSTPGGILIPIDLQGRWMKLHSILVMAQTSVAVSNPVQYVAAVYELQPAAVGAQPSPSQVGLNARLVQGTKQLRNLVVNPADPVTYHDSITLPEDRLLLPTKQYFVYLYTASVLISFLFPTQRVTGYDAAALPPSPIQDLPPTLPLRRAGVTDTHPAPLVTLRSRYGSFMYGDPSRE